MSGRFSPPPTLRVPTRERLGVEKDRDAWGATYNVTRTAMRERERFGVPTLQRANGGEA